MQYNQTHPISDQLSLSTNIPNLHITMANNCVPIIAANNLNEG